MRKYQYSLLFDLSSVRSQLLSTEHNRRLATGVVNRCKQTDGRNLLFTTVVRCADNARVKQEADQLLILNKPLIDFHRAIFLLVLEYGMYYGVTSSSL